MAWIVEAALRFKASVNWLVHGREADKINGNICQLPIIEPKLTSDNEIDVSHVQAYLPFNLDWLKNKGSIDDLALLRVTGNWMEPLIGEGDFILVNKAVNQPQPEAGIFVVSFNEAVFIKHLWMEPGKIVLRSENKKAYPDIEIALEKRQTIKIIGQVIWWSHDVY